MSTSSEKKVELNSQQSSASHQPATLISSLISVLFVISAVLIGFAAFRNTLTWHLENFWGASGDFWQALWDRLLDRLGEEPITLWVYGSLGLTIAVYWLFGAIYTFLDLTNKPAALRRYKIQPGTNEPVDTQRLLKMVLGNIYVIQIWQQANLIH